MKLNWKKILTDPAFWMLLAVNGVLFYEYEQSPRLFTTLIWLYWSQSIIFGFFTHLHMKSILKANFRKTADDIPQPGSPVSQNEANAWGFSVLFGIFHIIYFIFLAAMPATGPIDWSLFYKFLVAFVVFQVIGLIQQRSKKGNDDSSIRAMSTAGFLRVMPMHLCILIPAILNISHLTVFLVLKVIFDQVSHITTTSYYRSSIALDKANIVTTNSTISYQ